ncbi:MAG: hypothetical protein UU64_C0019G0006 [candidate division WWE3 bacterium GW2011_GWF2_41_45]|uniref:D-glucuronyl C5-epimerase C-terminal domain-containing protein n=3 Tax=Katanobacteria TaxID=422282 RepID=A0A1F4W2N0_UNCKA|nr:MAG: hypothetical protein UU55_C0005G0068 [candidate division WWE3 bacterium GW2011_GWC2_41_23]KKS08921.1 MAG: hypothetical protein UU64_C0019G0006 [candidate division WWE3 bacterium GW2011_GWF2_41_45]KKS11825.1 MAG: hypothetical protein UU68_C0010G0006 [candidate division WWE3 bacterium GW2011_GWF1_41_53]KKS19515.1 MAG: hypothetical protein UU79_C0017G0018 [candidate division WWE3 bacterium GW2011_GWE1_41_72]KKS25924.1 MAG: hypothetical protein UU86_C0046G0016 [candidate division WWE3 bacte
MFKSRRAGTFFSLLFLLIIIILITVDLTKPFLCFNEKKQNPQETFEKNLERSLILYGNWFIKNQTDAGDFNYELNVDTGEKIPNYNIVRQAGSFYSLTHAYKYTKNDNYKKGIEKGIIFFENLIEEVEGNVPMSRIKHEGTIQSNTVAVYLLALIEYIETDNTDKDKYLETSTKLANYLLYTQRNDGSFLQRLDPAEESDYNNGESFYALIRMYKLSGDKRYLTGATKAADYIILKYSAEPFNYSVFAWAMQGMAHLYSVEHDSKYWDFMKSYTDSYFKRGGNTANLYFRGYKVPPPKGNLGVYLEGLAHVAWTAKETDPYYYSEVSLFIKKSLEYLMSLQINGPASERKSAIPWISGGICYDYRCKTQRIDITHHNLSAIYFYLTYVK